MIAGIINDFRKFKGIEPSFYWHEEENKNCLEHCYYMANIGEVVHASKGHLKNKSEAVARCNFKATAEETLRHLVFEVLGKSHSHADILIGSENIAYAVHARQCTMYITIRGW